MNRHRMTRNGVALIKRRCAGYVTDLSTGVTHIRSIAGWSFAGVVFPRAAYLWYVANREQMGIES